MSFKRILVAVDESAFAAHAAEVAIDLSKSLGSEVAFISVVDPDVTCVGADAGVPIDRMAAMQEQETKRLLLAFQERAASNPVALIFVDVGRPATKIVEGARNWRADLIVIGSHGRGGVERILLGSVAESVLRHAPCPVLVIRGSSQ